MFIDDYLIGSPISKVRTSSQRLILSLFNKGNNEQQLKIISLIESRCDQLIWMGKASEDFLELVKNIFLSTKNYIEEKKHVIKKIFNNLEKIHNDIISNNNY